MLSYSGKTQAFMVDIEFLEEIFFVELQLGL